MQELIYGASHFPMISPEVNNQFNLWRD